MNLSSAKKLVGKAVEFFDVRGGANIDLLSEGKKVVYIDPLQTKIEANPTSVGHNDYRLVNEESKFEHPIKFQNGSPADGVNGLSNEALLAVLIHRLTKQNESFPTPYNVLAINLLQGALTALHNRVKDRQQFGIYDTNQVQPEGEEDAKLAHALAMVNSIGILQNVIFKFDHAYGLNVGNTVHGMLETIGKYIKPVENDEEANILNSFMLSCAAVGQSGVIRVTNSIAATVLDMGKEDATTKE